MVTSTINAELISLSCPTYYDIAIEQYRVTVSWTLNIPPVVFEALDHFSLIIVIRGSGLSQVLEKLTIPLDFYDCNNITVGTRYLIQCFTE